MHYSESALFYTFFNYPYNFEKFWALKLRAASLISHNDSFNMDRRMLLSVLDSFFERIPFHICWGMFHRLNHKLHQAQPGTCRSLLLAQNWNRWKEEKLRELFSFWARSVKQLLFEPWWFYVWNKMLEFSLFIWNFHSFASISILNGF